MNEFYIGCSGDMYWSKSTAKTLLGAMRQATKECQVSSGGKIEVAIKTDYGYEQVAVKHGFDKWEKLQ